MRVTILYILEILIFGKFLVLGMGLSYLRVMRQASNSTTNQQASNSAQQTNPNIFMQPYPFIDPGFSSASTGTGTNGGNSTGGQSGIPSQFLPSFLDPSKFSTFGQQPNSGFGGTFGQPSGSNGTSSAVMNPGVFTNPVMNASSGFNFVNPGQMVGKRSRTPEH